MLNFVSWRIFFNIFLGFLYVWFGKISGRRKEKEIKVKDFLLKLIYILKFDF